MAGKKSEKKKNMAKTWRKNGEKKRTCL